MYSEYYEKINNKNPFFIGTVVDNDDPTHNYRVKVRLPQIHSGIADADLPWAARVDRAFRGMFSSTPTEDGPQQEAGSGNQQKKDGNKQSDREKAPLFDHCVPEVGTKLLVLAVQNDVNSLLYLGALYKKTDYTPTNDKYLKSYGIYADKDQFIGIDLTANDKNKAVMNFIGDVSVDKVKQVDVNAEEDINITTKKNITIKATEEVEITIINEKGKVNVISKQLSAKITEDVDIQCKTINCNASDSATVISPKITLQGDVDITGNLTVGGHVKADGEVEGKGVKLSLHTHRFPHMAGDSASNGSTLKPS